tara:strand:- start:497 stop:1954 length:1458 start_codon:yes stop_codon:yes gene_type:complete
MEYEIVIGLEVHSQLLTKSKMFCACNATYQDAPPNTVICEVCMGMPGVLPVINKRAVELVISTGLALGCDIPRDSKFDRKNYPYPDLMKGYQISQYDQPVAVDGVLEITVDDEARRIGVTRVHLEEDVAKLSHHTGADGERYSLLDINRAGVPLMEIVSEPDMRSPDEAREYLTTLHSILRYIGASTADMEKGSFRCDANISVRPLGVEELGSKVEVKNMNSFRSVHRALAYEATRQVRAVEEGERIVSETRGWVEERGVTVSQRTKENASDYRYFPEPDLPPVVIDSEWVQKVRVTLPELPLARKKRFIEQYGLPVYDAALLTVSKPTADYFELTLAGSTDKGLAKRVSNWILGEYTRLMKEENAGIESAKVHPTQLLSLVGMIDNGKLSSNQAKEVLEKMFGTGGDPESIAAEVGIVQVSNATEVEVVVDEVLSSNPEPVQDYLNGKHQAVGFLMGEVMKITKGQANPKVASQLVREKLEALK